MGGVSDVGSKANFVPRQKSEPKEKEQPQEKPEAAEKPKEEQEAKASKEPAEVEAERITTAETEKEAEAARAEQAAADEKRQRDAFEPDAVTIARNARNGSPPLPPQGTEVTISGERETKDFNTSKAKGLQVEASAKVTNTKVEQDLKNTVTIEASATIGRYQGLEAGKESHLSVGGERLQGQKFTYETKVSKEQEQAIRDGTAQLPNPFDPVNMPEGSTAVLKGQKYQGTAFEASYRNIAAEAKITDYRGAGMSVEKLADNKVRISSGPVNAVESEVYAGLKSKELALGLKAKQTEERTNMKVAELDLNTQEGLDRYHRFLLTGEVPQADGDTVSRSGTVETHKISNEASAQLSIGPVDINAQLMASEGERKATQYTDGSKSEEVSLTYGQGINLTVNKDFDFRGTSVPDSHKPNPTYTLTMGKVDPRSAYQLETAFAQDAAAAEAKGYQNNPTQDAQISFSPDDALELKRMATEYVQQHPNSQGTGTTSTMQQIAEARNADEVAAVLAKSASTGRLADDLATLRYANGDKRLPGNEPKFQPSP